MAKSKEEINTYHRDWRSKNKEKTRAINVKYKYGIDSKEFEALLIKQGNRCAICLIDFDRDSKETTPHVDHCHFSNNVRGLLCSKCNAGLGQFTDDITLLCRAIMYLNGGGIVEVYKKRIDVR